MALVAVIIVGFMIHLPVVVIAIAAFVAPFVEAAIWPWRKCRRCSGDGKLFSPWSKTGFRPCSTCSGSGRQRRWLSYVVRRDIRW